MHSFFSEEIEHSHGGEEAVRKESTCFQMGMPRQPPLTGGDGSGHTESSFTFEWLY